MLVKGKYIVVSGIGPGLGVKLAVHAAIEEAAGVAIGCRSQEKLDDAVRRIRDTGANCGILARINDIRDANQCRAFAQEAINRFGRIDALINNAVFHGPLGDAAATTDFESWPEQYSTNVIGTMKMTHAVIPQMKTQGGGAIVMISTMGTKMAASVDEAGYCASKAALYNVTRRLAGEIGPDNIRVNTLHPGWMWGVPVQQAMPYLGEVWGGGEKKAIERVTALHALRRITTDDEVARAALFLASDYASAITGASLDANGGFYLP